MVKRFELGKSEDREGSYKGRILKILNAITKYVQIVGTDPGSEYHKTLHEQKLIDSREDLEKLKDVRKDLCAAFGVPENSDHIFYYTTPERKIGPVRQRGFEAFYVLVDLQRDSDKRAFFCEGRTDHAALLAKIIKEAKMDKAEVMEELIKDTSNKYLVFKGFMGNEVPRGDYVKDIFDENGKIETPPDWFLTGHNLPEPAEISNATNQ